MIAKNSILTFGAGVYPEVFWELAQKLLQFLNVVVPSGWKVDEQILGKSSKKNMDILRSGWP